jgi:hypothetical protein
MDTGMGRRPHSGWIEIPMILNLAAVHVVVSSALE